MEGTITGNPLASQQPLLSSPPPSTIWSLWCTKSIYSNNKSQTQLNSSLEWLNLSQQGPRTRISKIWPMGQIWPTAWFCTPWELRTVFTFFKGYKTKPNKNMEQRPYVAQKAKKLTIWSLHEKFANKTQRRKWRSQSPWLWIRNGFLDLTPKAQATRDKGWYPGNPRRAELWEGRPACPLPQSSHGKKGLRKCPLHLAIS